MGLFNLLFVASILAVASHAETTVYSTSWEPGTFTSGEWRALIRNWECDIIPCPVASIDFGSSGAARTNSAGAQVVVSTQSNEGWHVQIQSPVFNLSSNTVYTACVWVRSDIETGVVVPITLLGLPEYSWNAGGSVSVTTTWTELCASPFTPSTDGKQFYYVIDMGLITGTIFLDDFSLTSSAAPAPTAVYSTSWELGTWTATDWRTLIRDWDCATDPCPVATFDFASTDAAYDGSVVGVAVTVTTPSSAGWHVQLQSPFFPLSHSKAYTACVRARSPDAVGAVLPLTLLGLPGWVWSTARVIQLTASWQQLCTDPFTPGTTTALTSFYYVIDMGLITGTIYLDDFSLVAQDLNPSTTEPSPTEPTPTEPSPTEPSPTEPSTTEPSPAEPSPVDSNVSTSFEPGTYQPDDWHTNNNGHATFDFASTATARTGDTSVRVVVSTAVQEGWTVQLQSPIFLLSAVKQYTACFWVKASSGGGTISMSLIHRPNFSFVKGTALTTATSWTQVCVGPFTPSSSSTYYYTLDLASVADTFDIDDFSLTVEDLPAAPPPPPGQLYATSFEASDSGIWVVNVVTTTNCPCPTATYDIANTESPKTGSRAVKVDVSEYGSDSSQVQLVSPQFSLAVGTAYTACFWVRTTSPEGVIVPIALMQLPSYTYASGGSVVANTSWTRVCIHGFTPSNPSSSGTIDFYLALNLGWLVGTYYIDDFSITADPVDPDLAAYVEPASVAARIEQHRKGSFSLQFSQGGSPLSGASLSSLQLRLLQHDFAFGTAFEWDGVPDPADLDWYLATAKKHFNALVPEWTFKWLGYEPSKGNYLPQYNKFVNTFVNFTETNDNVMLRGHTLEWYTKGYAPNHWSRAEGCAAYRSYLETHIKREVTMLKGKVNSYDVFNEVTHELSYVKDCPGLWPSILYDGFRWAAEADPAAKLCINDYGLITGDDWQNMVYLVNAIRANGADVSCVGVQAYVSTTNRPTPAYMKPRLDALAALGVDIVISEFSFISQWDANGPSYSGSEAEQAALYDEYLRFWFSHPGVKAVLMWGFWDGRVWVTNGGIYNLDKSPKAAASLISNLWGSTWNTTLAATDVALDGSGGYGFNGFYGKYAYEVTVGGQQYSGTVRFRAADGSSQTVAVAL